MSRDVEDAVIAPMLAAFPPPTHLRGSRQAQETALGIYRRALDRFPRTVLEQAWQEAAQKQRYHCWPQCAVILAACEALHRETEPVDWLPEAERLLREYTARFLKTSQHAARARAGGYEAQLRAYVEEAGWVQAQLLAGRAGVGYSGGVLFGHLEGTPEEQHQQREEWFRKAEEQVARGQIRVGIPPAVLAQWKAQAVAVPQRG